MTGFDTALLWAFDSRFGEFRFRYLASFLRTYEQEPGGAAAALVAAKQAGTISASIPVRGFEDLVQSTGNQKQKHQLSLFWRNGPFGASLSNWRIGEIYQDSLTLADGTRWWLDAMSTWNATLDYYWDSGAFDARLRFGARNIGDERAPFADGYFGYLADVHRDYGRNYYVDIRLTRR